MKTVTISVTEAARNFADCINRARYQGTTFVLEKNGTPVARIVPEELQEKKGGTLRELAEALKEVNLTPEERAAWKRDLENARKILLPPVDRWQ
jgi:prevent-host-death family protein